GQRRREHARLQPDDFARRDGGGQFGTDSAVVVRRVPPRTRRDLTRDEPEPVIRDVHTRRIPPALARVGDRDGNRDLARALEEPRRADLNPERERIRRWRHAAAPGECDRGHQQQESGNWVSGLVNLAINYQITRLPNYQISSSSSSSPARDAGVMNTLRRGGGIAE